MPFLFKNIRRRWLDRKSLRKYLSYAVGEIILVVIGILIALQINSCNQEKEHRRVEKELLSKIKEDLEKDLMDFDMVKSFKSEQDRACKTLMTYFIQPSLELQDTAAFINDLILTAYFILPNKNQTGYDIGTSTGNLNHILNQNLLGELAAYHNDIQLNQHLTETKRFTNAFVENHMMPNYPMFSKVVDALDGHGGSYKLERYNPDERPGMDLAVLRKDRHLENYLNLLSIRLVIGIKGLEKLEKKCGSMIQSIDQELNEAT